MMTSLVLLTLVSDFWPSSWGWLEFLDESLGLPPKPAACGYKGQKCPEPQKSPKQDLWDVHTNLLVDSWTAACYVYSGKSSWSKQRDCKI